jgi:hypothetical protein
MTFLMASSARWSISTVTRYLGSPIGKSPAMAAAIIRRAQSTWCRASMSDRRTWDSSPARSWISPNDAFGVSPVDEDTLAAREDLRRGLMRLRETTPGGRDRRSCLYRTATRLADSLLDEDNLRYFLKVCWDVTKGKLKGRSSSMPSMPR